MAPTYDVLIIGSGFGGAVTACRLAEQGMKVLVLERGRRWEVKDYPSQSGENWIYNNDHPQREHGWVDWRFWGNMTVVVGAAVGGGSLIYANVSAPAHRECFDQGWPPEITYQELTPYYDRVGKMLNVQTLPDGQLTHRFKLMKEAAEKAGYGDRFTKMPVAITFDPNFTYDQPDPFNNKNSVKHLNDQGVEQGTCVHCGNCDFGCQVHAKNTLDLNYIPQAEKYHAEVRPLHYVRFIEPVDGGYRVTFDRIIPGGGFLGQGKLVRGSETARKVIVAAGSLGSTELLLRCRDQYKTLPDVSQFLGHHWSSNGDFLTLGKYPESRTIAPSWGPTITCYIDFLNKPYQDQRFVVEDGGFAPFVRDYVEKKVGQAEHEVKQPYIKAILDSIATDVRNEDPLKNIMPWFANGVDKGDGRLYLGHKWWWPWGKNLELDWPQSLQPTDTIIAMHTILSKVTGGKEWVSPTWTDLKWLITPHPLGGCNMGTDASNGVVNHAGAVFGYPGLYVADGAIVPEAIGINPSRTIACLSERIAHLIVTEETGRAMPAVAGV